MRGWKNIFHANGKQKKAKVAILISDKINFKIKITSDKEGHYIMIKGSIQEEDITIVTIYVPNKDSFKIDGEIKDISDKKKCEFNTTKPALQQMLKRFI